MSTQVKALVQELDPSTGVPLTCSRVPELQTRVKALVQELDPSTGVPLTRSRVPELQRGSVLSKGSSTGAGSQYRDPSYLMPT